jgi:putative flippase GtrA
VTGSIALVQFSKYALVGIASNVVLYIAYIGLTYIGMGHKLAMTLLYAAGVAQTFAVNRAWTFSHRGRYERTFIRYCLAYLFGYLTNLGALYLLVDLLRYPHQIVQGMMIILLAVMLFLIQRHWVFRTNGSTTATMSSSS